MPDKTISDQCPDDTQQIVINIPFLGATGVLSPVFGFRPGYGLYDLILNEHKPRISTRSPLARAAAI